jgi:outer membrane protein OmpA-like peptidoglycan-associated protein
MMKNIQAGIFFLFCLIAIPCRAQEFILEKLPAPINSTYDEITPVLSRDGRNLYFTRVAYPIFDHTLVIDSTDVSIKDTPQEYQKILTEVYTLIAGYPVYSPEKTGFNQDVWFSIADDSFQFQEIRHPRYPMNNALPNSLVAITPDPNAFYIINKLQRNGDMDRGFSLIRRQGDSTWTFPEPIDIKDYYTITSDVNLTMSFDGKVLILSAMRSDSKDMDLYVCQRSGENKWSAPVHMGTVLNTSKRETTPFLSEDNTTLFFSSNRWNTSGGNDIFMSKRLDETWTNWSEPVRLTEPINSAFDDSQPYFNMTSGYLYFTSKRAGSSDIYRVRIAPPQPTEIRINGRILNSRTKELITNAQLLYGVDGGIQQKISASDGYFSIQIPKGIAFQLTPAKAAFNGITDTVLFRRDYYYFRDLEIELYLDPLELNGKIDLHNIYFQQSKAVILESSFPELERLATILAETPNLNIRVEGHTDNQGKPEGLKQLSEERAAAIKQYLTDKGIASERIETIGHGAAYPISSNDSEAERAKNRRVEIRITKL